MKHNLEDQTKAALMIFCAHALTMNDEYTRFLGMFKHQEKQKFNDLINACKSFVSTIKERMPKDDVENIKQLQELMHDFYYSLIKGEEVEIIKK